MIEFHASAGRRFAKDFSTNYLFISSAYFNTGWWQQIRRLRILSGVVWVFS